MEQLSYTNETEENQTCRYDSMSSQLIAKKIEHHLDRMRLSSLGGDERHQLEVETNDMLFILSERQYE